MLCLIKKKIFYYHSAIKFGELSLIFVYHKSFFKNINHIQLFLFILILYLNVIRLSQEKRNK
jgi:hypothetical protein